MQRILAGAVFLVGTVVSSLTQAQVGPTLKFTNTVPLTVAVNTNRGSIYVGASQPLVLTNSYTNYTPDSLADGLGFLIDTGVLVSATPDPIGDLYRATLQPSVTPKNIWVSPAGSDNNSCSSVTRACFSPQGAINKLPKLIQNTVNVTVMGSPDGGDQTYYSNSDLPDGGASSNVTAMTISGFVTDYSNSDAGLTISCAVKEVIPVSPITSVSQSVATTTINNSGATWTVNAAQNGFVEVLTGTGVGNRFAVVSNTATTMVFESDGLSAPVDTTSTFHIVAPAVHFSNALASASTVGLGAQAVLVSGAHGVKINGCDFTGATTGIGLWLTAASSEISITNDTITGPVGGFGMVIGSTVTGIDGTVSGVTVDRCAVNTSATNSPDGIAIKDAANVSIQGSVLVQSGSSTTSIDVAASTFTSVFYNYITGSLGGISENSDNREAASYVVFQGNNFTNTETAVSTGSSGDILRSRGSNSWEGSATGGFADLVPGTVLLTRSTDVALNADAGAATNFASPDQGTYWITQAQLESFLNRKYPDTEPDGGSYNTGTYIREQ